MRRRSIVCRIALRNSKGEERTFTYYQFLGVAPTATEEEIKAAFRKKSKRWHPDVYKKGPELFVTLKEVYDALTDPAQRLEIDYMLGVKQRRQQQHVYRFDHEDAIRRAHAQATSNTASEMFGAFWTTF